MEKFNKKKKHKKHRSEYITAYFAIKHNITHYLYKMFIEN